jgi:hypothetical protein
MEQTFATYGRGVILAGIVPVALVLALVLLLLYYLGLLPTTLVGQSSGPAVTEWTVIVLFGAGFLGPLLVALNKPLIHLYEGAYSFQRRWFLKWALQRNLRRYEELYTRLLTSRQMRTEALALLQNSNRDGAELADGRRRLHSTTLEIDNAHGGLEQVEQDRSLPLQRTLVAPTALGNAYAVMEAYPFERYGMDSMVFWPRLLQLLPENYRASVGEQKTTCDMLLHLSFLFTLYGLLALGLTIYGVLTSSPTPDQITVMVVTVLAIVVAYSLYRASVSETRVLGKLVVGAFDLYRGQLLVQMGFELPEELSEEQELWGQLAAFIRRGEPFYYPQVSGPAVVKRAVQSTRERSQ